MPRGRPPSAKTLVDRQLGRNIKHPVLPAGDDFIVPNYSGVGNELKEGLATNLGTEGSVLFLNSTGNITEDNSNLFWDDTNNRLGIGNAIPTVDLDVSGVIRASTSVNSAVFAEHGSASNANIAMSSSDTMTFDTGGLQAMHIDANQNVIIGNTTTADGLLNVFSGSAGTVSARVGGDDLVIEHSTNGGMSILTPDTNTSTIIFGSPTDPLGADIKWNHDNDVFIIGSRKTDATLRFVSGGGVTALNINKNQNFDFQDGNLTTTGTLAAGATTITGNIAVSGTVDGVDIAARDHDAVTVTDSSTINFTLTTQDITASTIDSAIDHDALLNFLANEHIDWTSTSSNFSTTGTLSVDNAAVFNESGADVDFKIEGDTSTLLFVADASLDAIEIGTTTQGNIAKFNASNIIFNETGADIDFRVEGDTDTSLLHVDASTDSVGIGIALTNTGTKFQVNSDESDRVRVTIKNTHTTSKGTALQFLAASVNWEFGTGANVANDSFFITDNTAGQQRMFMAAGGSTAFITGGLEIGSPTGGHKGNGTINTQGDIFKNNTAYTNPDYVLEKYYTGKIEKYKDNSGAKDYIFMTIPQVEHFIKINHRLPGISDKAMGVFERSDKTLEKIEELYIHIIELNKKIEKLEANSRK